MFGLVYVFQLRQVTYSQKDYIIHPDTTCIHNYDSNRDHRLGNVMVMQIYHAKCQAST